MNIQNRLKSKTAWASLITLLIFVAKTYFNYELPEADTLINLLLVVTSAFGIWNNPSDSEKF
jgi:uncharacterized membrane protein